jgi:uncharacterized protein DUF6894
VPRYHFIVYDGLNISDPDGTELPDLRIAQIEAARLAGGLLQDNAPDFCELRTWQIEVVDEDGLVVFRIDLTASETQQKQTRENYPPRSS